jgi:hypothetical protein
MSTEKKNIIVKCEDNCSCMSIDNWEDEPEYFITFYKSYSGHSLWNRIKDSFWHIFGRDIIGTELIITEKDFEKIRNFNNESKH